jgi:hypothetical protein
MTSAQLFECEHDYGVVFDNDMLSEVADYLSSVFSGFNYLELTRFLSEFAKEHDLQFDFIAAGASEQGFRMEWVAADNSVYAFLLDRVLVVRNEVKIAIHNLFTLPERLQGRGLAKVVLLGFYKQYQAASIQQIELMAGKFIGGYAWALYGFDAIDRQTVCDIIELGRARPDITHEESNLHLNVFNDFYKENPPESPFPMRVLATSPGGKALLKGTNWRGVLDLQNELQRELFETYIGLIE